MCHSVLLIYTLPLCSSNTTYLNYSSQFVCCDHVYLIKLFLNCLNGSLNKSWKNTDLLLLNASTIAALTGVGQFIGFIFTHPVLYDKLNLFYFVDVLRLMTIVRLVFFNCIHILFVSIRLGWLGKWCVLLDWFCYNWLWTILYGFLSLVLGHFNFSIQKFRFLISEQFLKFSLCH